MTYDPSILKQMYRAIGSEPPASLDLPSKKGLRDVKNRPHFTEKDRQGIIFYRDKEVTCPQCEGGKIDPVTKEPCEWCRGEGGWIEQEEVEKGD